MSDKTLLKATLLKLERPIYAVLDGAKFNDLPALLFDNDLSHKPLYRDMGSELREVELTTPQFVRFDRWKYWENDLTPTQRLESLLEIIEDISAAVFWEYDGEPKTLFKHLRTINNIMIPRDADTPPMPDPLDPEGETFGNTASHQQVLFRHADANVMAQVLPCLNPQQLTRTLGPARSVIFAPEPEWGAGEDIMQIANPKDTYNPTHPLKLSNPDMDRLEKRRKECLTYQTMVFLEDNAADKMETISKAEIITLIQESQTSADELGITASETREFWAYLALKTQKASLTANNVSSYIKRQPRDIDQVILELSHHFIGVENIDLEALFPWEN